MGMKIVLTKEFTRESSLFYAYVWSESNLHGLSQWMDNPIRHLLFIYQDGKYEVWFEKNALRKLENRICKIIKDDSAFFDSIIQKYAHECSILNLYISHKKDMRSLDDLKHFYTAWHQWWTPMAILFVIPNREELQQKIRQKALALREKHEKYTRYANSVYTTFIEKFYPDYKKYASFLKPEEVWKIESLTESDLLKIKSRMDDHALYNLSTYTDKTAVCKKFGIILQDEIQNKANHLQGQGAYKGTARGYVQKIMKSNTIAHFQKGNILVISMTDRKSV